MNDGLARKEVLKISALSLGTFGLTASKRQDSNAAVITTIFHNCL